MEGEGEVTRYSTSLSTLMICVSLFGTMSGGVEVDEAGDSFEEAHERSDIGEWRVLLFEPPFYAEMVGSEGASSDRPRLILGQTQVPWVPRCYQPWGSLAI